MSSQKLPPIPEEILKVVEKTVRGVPQAASIIGTKMKNAINKKYKLDTAPCNLSIYRQYVETDAFKQLGQEHQDMFLGLLRDYENALNK